MARLVVVELINPQDAQAELPTCCAAAGETQDLSLGDIMAMKPYRQSPRERPSRGLWHRAGAVARRARLNLELLEDRVTPSVLVTTPLDETNANDGRLSLREAIAMVNAGQVPDNTIVLPAGTYLNTMNAQVITHSLILQGAGATRTVIDGDDTDRVFLIQPQTAVTVQFSGVTIRDGSAIGSGGGIDVQDVNGQSSTLTVQNCTITANLAMSTNTTNYGGGIAVNNGDLNVIGCQIVHNQIVGAGGDGWGGGVADGNSGTGNLTVTNSLISDNTAGSAGGGVALLGLGSDPGNLDISGSTVSNNLLTSSIYGGGGVFANTMGKVSIVASTLSGNTSLTDGGGLEVFGDNPASIALSSATITGNQSAQGSGGGIAVRVNTDVVVQESTLSSNVAALSGGGFSDIANGMVTITGCTVASNRAVQNGGGIWYTGTAGVSISGSVVSSNITSTNMGGGLLVAFGAATTSITDSVFSDNQAVRNNGGAVYTSSTSLTVTGSTFIGNVSHLNGAGIDDSVPTTTVTDCTFSANVCQTGGGGAINLNGAGPFQKLSLTQDTFQGNVAGDTNENGGAIQDESGNGTIIISNSLFLDNVAGAEGGAIDQASGTLAVTNSQFSGNIAGMDGGGAIFSDGITLTVTNSTFEDNFSQGVNGGGALWLNALGTLANKSASVLTNDTFVGNMATGNGTFDGGGAIADVGPGDLILLNDTITGNTAGINGGGVALLSGNGILSFQNTIVAQNTAAGSGSDVFTATNLTVTDNGGNLLGTTGGSAGFGAGTQVGVNPLLGRLQNNGGPTAGGPGAMQVVQTEAFLPGSAAFGKGKLAGAPTTDERGFNRPGGGATNPSIGAYEPQYPANASANQVFVENVYEVLLNRPADSGGLAVWINQLKSGTTPSALVLAIEGSTEYRTDEVQALYQRYLHRQADPGGLSFWVNGLANGSTLEQIAAGITGSSEYFQLHGGNNLAFLDALYEDALGRLPDPFGLDSFSPALASGATPAAIAALVFGSPEYQQDLIENGYQAILGRQADPGGLAFFEQALANGTTDQTLIADLLGSGESFDERT